MRIINFGGGSGLPSDFINADGKINMEYIPQGVVYESIRSTNAGNTPKDITWYNDSGVAITGTLTPSADTTELVYFVKNEDYYDQYMTFNEDGTYGWYKIGTSLINAVSGITYTVVENI